MRLSRRANILHSHELECMPADNCSADKAMHVACLVAAKEVLDDFLTQHSADLPPEVRKKLLLVLADDFLSIDDGRFGLAEPLSKAAGPPKYSDPLSPKDAAITITRLIRHLMQRSKIHNRPKFVMSVKEHLAELNALALSKKKNNPSAAIGAAINIIKNILQSQPPLVISSIIGQLYRML